MSVERFTSQNIGPILTEIQEAVEAVAAKHGLEVSRSPCTYQQDRVKLSCLTLSTVQTSNDGTTTSVTERDFRMLAKSYGLEPDDFGATFTDYRSETFTIEGIKPRARKNTVLVKKARNQKIYVMPHATVKRHLDRCRAQAKAS
jgi:hypothetical protein